MPQRPVISTDTLYQLMPHRVREVLLVASQYDAFILEEGGHLFEQIWDEYRSLNIVSVPRVTYVTTLAESREMLSTRRFDLVVTMQPLPDGDPEELVTVAEIMPVD